MNNNEYISALDIEQMYNAVDNKVQETVKSWIKAQLISKVRQYKKTKQQLIPDYVLTKEDKDLIKREIINSDELKLFQTKQRELFISRANNYAELRKSVSSLNQLNEFSSIIESIGLQQNKTLDMIETLIQKLSSINPSLEDFISKCINQRNKTISKHQLESKNEMCLDPLECLITLRSMYPITKDVDELYLFDKYNFQSNIDFSQKLSDYYSNQISNNDNIINDWFQNISNPIEQIVKKTIIPNRLFSVLLGQQFISNNQVTCYKSTYTTTNNNKHTFVTRTLGELLLEITNTDLQHIPKEDRQQIYSTYDGSRPLGTEYYKWNGLQVFDIDLKPWVSNFNQQQKTIKIEQLKQLIFNRLSKYHWFLWVVKSASGNGIHIYTKSTPAHHVYTNISDNELLSKFWFQVNYFIKVNLIYRELYDIQQSDNSIDFGTQAFENDYELKYLDNVVSRITAGIRLTYDDKVLVNPNFIDLHVAMSCLDNRDTEFINNLILSETKSKWTQKYLGYIAETVNECNQTEIKTKQKLVPSNLKYDTFDTYEKLEVIPRQKLNYNVRYNVCNTLAFLFGKDGIEIAHKILQSKECGNQKEINGFYTCAMSNKKEPTKYGLELLQKTRVIKNLNVLKPIETETTENNQSLETEEQSTENNQVSVVEYANNLFKNGIRHAIDNACKLDTYKHSKSLELTLEDNQYLSDVSNILMDETTGGFTNSKINILISPPGSGKTHFLLNLARQGKRILLVEPYISVIKNKVESDTDLMSIFDVFYGDKNLNDIEVGYNAITTFDKFSRCNYDKISKMFDLICIDESHLLFTSSYRIEATSNVVRKLKELYHISNNDPFSAKIILMTGTETGDTHFFGKISNTIRVSKKGLKKTMEFLICDDSLDAITRLSFRTYKLLNDGYRVLIPTNKGEIYSQKLVGMLEHLLKRPLKYGYYKRSNVEQEICRLINEKNTIGDYEVIFCSNYLSVGVDIIDKHKFASLYWGNFSGYEIEQFNARIRKTNIYSIYCIQTETADGEVNPLLLEEPSLSLKLTNEDIENFVDDKSIAGAKQEFIAQYDPVLHKITTPGFSYLNGSIRFNKEEYELIMFENKYLEAMVHPVKVARELFKYQYEIIVSPEYDGLDLIKQNELKSIGIEAARVEKIRKHNLLVGTYLELIDYNHHTTVDGLEFNNIIEYIGKNRDLIAEDREQENCVLIEFNVFGAPTKVSLKNKEAFENIYGSARFLINKYSPTKAKELILHYTDENGILKLKHFKRAINLLKLIDKSDTNDLSEPVFKTIEKMYTWLDTFNTNKNHRISYNNYQAELDAWTNSYIDMLGIKIHSIYGYQKIKDNIIEMLNDIATKNTSKHGIRFDYNQLPDTDSVSSKYKQTIDNLIESTFKITLNHDQIGGISSLNPKQKHLVLPKQTF